MAVSPEFSWPRDRISDGHETGFPWPPDRRNWWPLSLLDAESTAAGISLSLPGAVALAVGLWTRPRGRGLGNALVIAGAALAAIWVWIVFMTPMAIAVIVGVLISQVRSTAPTVGTP